MMCGRSAPMATIGTSRVITLPRRDWRRFGVGPLPELGMRALALCPPLHQELKSWCACVQCTPAALALGPFRCSCTAINYDLHNEVKHAIGMASAKGPTNLAMLSLVCTCVMPIRPVLPHRLCYLDYDRHTHTRMIRESGCNQW